MNRKQLVVLGLTCLLAALASFDIGSRYSGVWFAYLVILCPSLLLGSCMMYLLRGKELPVNNQSPREWPYAAAVRASLLLIAVGLLVLGAG